MNAHVPSMSIWLLVALVCWFLAAVHAGIYYGQPAQPTPGRWGWGFSLGWLGMFCWGMSQLFR